MARCACQGHDGVAGRVRSHIAISASAEYSIYMHATLVGHVSARVGGRRSNTTVAANRYLSRSDALHEKRKSTHGLHIIHHAVVSPYPGNE
jgi:uncharacterized protein (DUF779 family)